MENVSEQNDAQLILQCRNGNHEAFNVLYMRYRSRLFAYLLKITPGNHSLAEDIFQQVWMKVIPSIGKYNDKERFLAWLCRIGHNLVIDNYRRSSVRGFHVELNDEIDTPDSNGNELLDYDEEGRHATLEAAIRDLPPEHRVILEMRKEGIPFKEISEKLGINLNTALGRMHQAVQKLKIALREYL